MLLLCTCSADTKASVLQKNISIDYLFAQASDSPQRHRVPQSLAGAQQELKMMLEVEQQRRAAATASRARSRIISRAEGSFDAQRFAERSNVASAAAEQLRKLVEATGREVSQQYRLYSWGEQSPANIEDVYL